METSWDGVRVTCAACTSADDLAMDESKGMLFCKRCGAVIKESIETKGLANVRWDDKTQEWLGVRVNENDAGANVAKALSLVDQSLTGTGKRRLLGSSWPAVSKGSKAVMSKDVVTAPLKSTAAKLHLPESVIHETRCLLHEICETSEPHAGFSQDDMEYLIGACVYISSRKLHQPTTLTLISSKLGCDVRHIGRIAKKVQETLQLQLPPPDLFSYSSRCLVQLSLPSLEKSPNLLKRVKEDLRTVLRLMELRSISTGVPQPIVGAAAILACLRAQGCKELCVEQAAEQMGCAVNSVNRRGSETARAVEDVRRFILANWDGLGYNHVCFPGGGGMHTSSYDRQAPISLRDVQVLQCLAELFRRVDLQSHCVGKGKASHLLPSGVLEATAAAALPLASRPKTFGLPSGAEHKAIVAVKRPREHELSLPVPHFGSACVQSYELTALEKSLHSVVLGVGTCGYKKTGLERSRIKQEAKYAKVMKRVSKRSSLWKKCLPQLRDAFPALDHPRCKDVMADALFQSCSPLSRNDVDLVSDIAAASTFGMLRDAKGLPVSPSSGIKLLPPSRGHAARALVLSDGSGRGGEVVRAGGGEDPALDEAEMDRHMRSSEEQKFAALLDASS